MAFQGGFWSEYFMRIYIPKIEMYHDAIMQRLLPTFAAIREEAEQFGEEEWKRCMNLPSTDETDPSDIAECVQERAVDQYILMIEVKQAVLNLALMGLYHLFEQQLLLFHRRQVLHQTKQDNLELIQLKELKKRLLLYGINLAQLTSWQKIEELKSVANTIKHAEGQSAVSVRKMRPDLFRHPALENDSLSSILSDSAALYAPMAGQDLYITSSDFEEYCLTIVRFWREFANALERR